MEYHGHHNPEVTTESRQTYKRNRKHIKQANTYSNCVESNINQMLQRLSNTPPENREEECPAEDPAPMQQEYSSTVEPLLRCSIRSTRQRQYDCYHTIT